MDSEYPLVGYYFFVEVSSGIGLIPLLIAPPPSVPAKEQFYRNKLHA